MGHYKQGIYKVINASKYIGTKNPRYLSSWELTAFKFLDLKPDVIKWGSEVVVVKYGHPYKTPVDGRQRRYMVDLYIEYKDVKGELRKELVEIKPHAQTHPPVKSKGKKTKTVLTEQATWAVNQAKWIAAAKYAKMHGWIFRIITEYDIYR